MDVLASDFNMVEYHQDKTNQCGHLVSLTERALFTNLKQPLHVEDNLQYANNPGQFPR